MIITLVPQRRDGSLSLEKHGDTLTINGEAFDFAPLPDGGTLPASAIASDFVVGDVRRVDGLLSITLVLPHGPNPSEAVAFPEPIEWPADGVIAVPFDPEPEPEEFDMPEEPEEEEV